MAAGFAADLLPVKMKLGPSRRKDRALTLRCITPQDDWANDKRVGGGDEVREAGSMAEALRAV